MGDRKGEPQSAILSELAEKSSVAKAKCELQQRRILKGHFGKIYAMHWATDSRHLVSASQDGKLIIWNAFTTNKEHAIALRSSWVMTCAYSPDGTMVASGGLDNIVSIYKLPTDKRGMSGEKPLAELAQHEGYLSCCRFLDDHNILSSSGDSTCILWDLDRRAPRAVFTEHTQDVMCVSNNMGDVNLFVSGSCDAKSKVWDIRQKKAVMTFGGHDSDINSVCFLPDGTAFASGSDDSSCGLFDLRSASQINRYSSNKILSGATCVTFSRTGRLLFASYDESSVHTWDTLTGAQVGQLDGHEERVAAVHVSPDGLALATASWDTTMKIWA